MTLPPPPPDFADEAPAAPAVMYSEDAERAVIGSILLSAEYLADVLFLTPDDFYIIRNRLIFEAIMWLQSQGASIDVGTVSNRLTALKQIDEVGSGYPVECVLSVPSGYHAGDYARIVKRDSTRRRMLAAAELIAGLCLDAALTTDELVSQAAAAVGGLRAMTDRELSPASELMPAYWDTIESRMGAADPHCLTGLKDVDAIIRGLNRKNLVYIASRTGQGKTSLMLGIASHEAKRGKRVGVFSLEMSNDETLDRLASAESGIPVSDLRAGLFGDLQAKLLLQARDRIVTWPLYVDDTASLTPLKLAAKVRRAELISGPFDLIIVDYVQLMSADRTNGKKYGNRYEEVTEVSRMLKVLAGDLNVTLIAGAQMSRAIDQRQDKRPSLSDLRDSGGLEQDANVVLFIHTPDPNVSQEREIIVAKNRQGSTGQAAVMFDAPHTRFLDAHTVSLK